MAQLASLSDGTVKKVVVDYSREDRQRVLARGAAPSLKYTINPSFACALGMRYVDGRATVLLTDWTGAKIADARSDADLTSQASILGWMAESARALLDQANSPALVGTGFVTHTSEHGPLRGGDVERDLGAYLRQAGVPERPVIAVHPGYAGGFAEAWLGTSGNAVFVRWADEINVGVILDGRVQRADSLDKSLYGHIPTGDETEQRCDHCDRDDCLVLHAGARILKANLIPESTGDLEIVAAVESDLTANGHGGIIATAAQRIARPLGPTLTVLGIKDVIVSFRVGGSGSERILSSDSHRLLARTMGGSMSVSPGHGPGLPDPHLRFLRPRGTPIIGAAATVIDRHLGDFAPPVNPNR